MQLINMDLWRVEFEDDENATAVLAKPGETLRVVVERARFASHSKGTLVAVVRFETGLALSLDELVVDVRARVPHPA